MAAPDDEYWMMQAIRLAQRGEGFVEPNPMVGAVVVRDGKLLGEGWHQSYGQHHAEVNAIAAAGANCYGATLYVTLEPCCHFGKTPPCTDAVLAARFTRVVIAMRDPFPQVAGQGIAILQQAGISCTVGVCEQHAVELNAPYLKRLQSGKPWVHLKWAMTLDGKIATHTGDSKWISNEQSLATTHRLRGRMDAILIGMRTLLADDPLLTPRPPGARIPTRIVVSRNSENVPDSAALLRSIAEAPVEIWTHADQVTKWHGWQLAGAQILVLPELTSTTLNLSHGLNVLAERKCTNILVEGGAGLHGSMLDQDLVDEIHVFVAPKLFGNVHAPGPVAGYGVEKLKSAHQFRLSHSETLENDLYLRYRCSQRPEEP
ncbi:MAG: bifunctional diaminohydroxyphosphoribosylaminopyrimidine deaminase/5-amino-6-(5-phosphoribosylamino)uracil reductase RibD [Zavarzinella sp.]